eukprot:Opistho-2@97120
MAPPGDSIAKPRHILVLYTGGTIGMKPSERGYVPAQNYLGHYLYENSQFHDKAYSFAPTDLERAKAVSPRGSHGEELPRLAKRKGANSNGGSPTTARADKTADKRPMPATDASDAAKRKPLMKRSDTLPSIATVATPSSSQAQPNDGKRAVGKSVADEGPVVRTFACPMSRFGKRVLYDLKEFPELLDSSNMTMEDWIKIGSELAQYYDYYDGFVVLHGTDTMAYSASALSFVFENLSKTIILTGSQVPLTQPQSDGIDNFLGALCIAGHFDIPEVCLYFHNHLFRGNRTKKIDASSLDAFGSGGFPPLASVGIDIDVNWDIVRTPGQPGRICTHMTFDQNIGALLIFPGITTEAIRNFLRPPMRGVVLLTYGAGNAPDRNKDLLDVLKQASASGIVLVNCTQCPRGMVEGHYATGRALYDAGVVAGFDMTVECALAKMSYLLGRYGADPECPRIIRRLMSESLRGELRAPEVEMRFSFRDKHFVSKVANALAESFRNTNSTDATIRKVEAALAPVLACSAASFGDVKELENLHRGGVDLNAGDYDGRTAMMLSACGGHVDVVKYLLDIGCDPNSQDRWGGTALSDALKHEHDAVVQVLRERGARLVPGDELTDKLCSLAAKGDAMGMEKLLANGALANSCAHDQRTPLHISAAEGHAECVKVLLRHSAFPLARDRWGVTPIEEAKAGGHTDIVRALKKAATTATAGQIQKPE